MNTQTDPEPAQIPAASREQIRRLDQDAISQLGIPGLVLMENAARGVCDVILSRGSWRSITILCGPGNNGGDGLAVARLLAASGLTTRVHLIRGGKRLSGDAGSNLGFLTRAGLAVYEPDLSQLQSELLSLQSDDLIVDALLGTGVRGLVDSPFVDVIGLVNQSPAFVLAVDVPSGLDCNLGAPCGAAIRARITVTLAAPKSGFLNPAAQEFTGEWILCHIGLPRAWVLHQLQSHT